MRTANSGISLFRILQEETENDDYIHHHIVRQIEIQKMLVLEIVNHVVQISALAKVNSDIMNAYCVL